MSSMSSSNECAAHLYKLSYSPAKGLVVANEDTKLQKCKLFWNRRRILSAFLILLAFTLIVVSIVWARLAQTQRDDFHDEDYHRKLAETVGLKTKHWMALYNKYAGRGNDKKDESAYGKSLPSAVIDNSKEQQEYLATFNIHIPSSFDARKKWALCSSISAIMHQGKCKSHWAISAASVMSDRICVKSGGELHTLISADDVLTCCEKCHLYRCEHGDYWSPYLQWLVKGVVSGGPYGSSDGCKPYTIAGDCGVPCFQSTHAKFHGMAPNCVLRCRPLFGTAYNSDKHYAKKVYTLNKIDEEETTNSTDSADLTTLTQKELLLNGPVGTCFDVFEDWEHYHSGVYHHVAGRRLELHCGKIVGWGESGGERYWLIANSWGRQWGENGFFRLSFNHTLTAVLSGNPRFD